MKSPTSEKNIEKVIMSDPVALISELLTIDRGLYIVKVIAQRRGEILATGLGAAPEIEIAEDRARERALAALALGSFPAKPMEARGMEENQASPPPDGNGRTAPPAPEPESRRRQPDRRGKTKPTAEKETAELNASHDSSQLLSPDSALERDRETSIPESISEPEIPTANQPSLWEGAEPPSTIPPLPEAGTRAGEAFPQPSPEEETFSAPQPQPPVAASYQEETPFDFSDIIAKTDIEMKRLGWTQERGRKYLLETYGKKSRQVLSDEELIEFLTYLESQ